MLSIIVATAENNGIGKGNKIPWHLPKDWKRFATLTKGHTIIIGRATFESILEYLKKPLPERTSIVITRNGNYNAPPGTVVVHSLHEALEHAKTNEETFIGGGAQIYQETLPFTDRIYLTRVHTTIDADAFFPEINEGEWVASASEFVPKDDKNQYDMTFLTYDRRSSLTKEA